MQHQNFGDRQTPPVTPLVRATLAVLIITYVLQLLLQNWMGGGVYSLSLWSFSTGNWRPWQPVTSLLLNGEVVEAFFDWIFLFFIMGPVETLVGRKRFIRAMLWSVGLAILIVTGLDLLGAVNAMSPYTGVTPALLAMLVIFGLSMPNANIMLFFVLPIRAAWIAWASGLLSLLMFISARDLGSAMALGGWIGGYTWIISGGGSLRRLMLHMRKRKVQKELKRFTVIEGGRGGDHTIH